MLSFIGNVLAKKEPRFSVYARLGFQKAEQYAGVECIKKYYTWREKLAGRKPTLKDLLELSSIFIEELGIAELFPTLKELTRITMIQGDTKEWIPFSKPK